VRAVARYRVEHDVPDEIPALGPEPADQRVRAPWRQAERLVAEVQQRLDRGACLER
jgi:hypothetical protein